MYLPKAKPMQDQLSAIFTQLISNDYTHNARFDIQAGQRINLLNEHLEYIYTAVYSIFNDNFCIVRWYDDIINKYTINKYDEYLIQINDKLYIYITYHYCIWNVFIVIRNINNVWIRLYAATISCQFTKRKDLLNKFNIDRLKTLIRRDYKHINIRQLQLCKIKTIMPKILLMLQANTFIDQMEDY